MKTDNRKKKIWLILQIALLVFTLVWIWGHSCVSIPESSSESGRIVAFLQRIFHGTAWEEHITDHLVRKMAHFAEFAFLGAQIMLLFLRKKQRLFWAAISIGAGVALLDETIQIFAERGDRIADVWLDIGGVTAGVLFMLLCAAIWRNRTKKL